MAAYGYPGVRTGIFSRRSTAMLAFSGHRPSGFEIGLSWNRKRTITGCFVCRIPRWLAVHRKRSRHGVRIKSKEACTSMRLLVGVALLTPPTFFTPWRKNTSIYDAWVFRGLPAGVKLSSEGSRTPPLQDRRWTPPPFSNPISECERLNLAKQSPDPGQNSKHLALLSSWITHSNARELKEMALKKSRRTAPAGFSDRGYLCEGAEKRAGGWPARS